MAKVNFFARLGNLFRGFLSIFITDIEKAHPEIAYENAINGMKERYAGLKKATAGLIRRRDEIDRRLAEQKQQLEQASNDLEAALSSGDDEVAMLVIQKKEQVEQEIAGLMHNAEQAEHEADEAKSSLMEIQGEIKALQSEKDAMLAKLESADARRKIQEQLDGLSVEADVQALEGVRKHIHNVIAEADLGAELQGTDVDRRLKQVRKSGAKEAAKKKLEAIKKQRAAEAESGRSL